MSPRAADLPSALVHAERLRARLAGHIPAVFLDFDGTLTPIVERPDLALLDDQMRHVVRALAQRCPVCIVSGRDRPDLERRVGIETLSYAGGHGFDIAIAGAPRIHRRIGGDFDTLLGDVVARLHRELDLVEGVLIEAKSASVAAHYRQVARPHWPRVEAAVVAILAEHTDRLRLLPGKMVFEIQPKIDWDKGKAVLYLLEMLGLNRRDVVPMYFGDDDTDEHAFAALHDRGIGVFVGGGDAEWSGERFTAAHYACADQSEVAELLDSLAR